MADGTIHIKINCSDEQLWCVHNSNPLPKRHSFDLPYIWFSLLLTILCYDITSPLSADRWLFRCVRKITEICC